MAIAFVRQTAHVTGANVNTVSGSFGTLPVVGNHIVATSAVWHDNSTGQATPGTITYSDNQGNTWATDKQQNNAATPNASSTASVGTAKVATSAGTFTVTFADSYNWGNYWEGDVSEFSGLVGVAWLDQTGSATATSGTTTMTVNAAGANAQADELVIVVMTGNVGTANIGVGTPTGFTALGVNQDANATIGYQASYKIVSAVETSSATWNYTSATGNGYGAVIATYKAAVTAASGGPAFPDPSAPFPRMPWWPARFAPIFGSTTIGNPAITAPDAGVGDDSSVVVTGAVTATDAGAGTEALAVTALTTASESGTGSEAAVTSAAVGATETGAGTDATSVVAVVGPSDNGSGSETLSTVAIVGLTDSGGGSDSAAVTAAVASSDAGSGSDAAAVSAATNGAESGSGGESFSVAATIATADAGSGSEAVSVTIGGTTLVVVVDGGSGTENTGIVKAGQIGQPEAGIVHGHDHLPSFRYPLEQRPGVAREISVADSGRGSAATETAAVVLIYDEGRGRELAAPSWQLVRDGGCGTEYASVQKVEDPDSELRTIVALRKAGAITADEYGVLLGEVMAALLERR